MTRAAPPVDAAPRLGKIALRQAALLSAMVWLGQLSVALAGGFAGGGPSAGPAMQGARVLVALAGFALTLGVHLLTPAPNGFWRGFRRSLLFCAPAALGLTVYSYFQFQWLAVGGTQKNLLLDIAFSFAYYMWIFVSWAALYAGLHTLEASQAQARRLAEIEARAHRAQLSALRYQLNPHFFFNVLNTLSGLIGSKRLKEAERVIIAMADFLRYSLSQSPAELVTLEEEAAAQRTYLEIERVRFRDRLKLDLDIPDPCRTAAVPGLILQPLVENAVKHAVGRSEAPVAVAIGARREDDELLVWVENTAPDMEGAAEGLGVGLKNVAERLTGIYGDRGRLEAGPTGAGGWRSRIILPFSEATE